MHNRYPQKQKKTSSSSPPKKNKTKIQEGTNGDLHLRKLAAAGLSHVHLLPTFDFGSVPERPEARREAELPRNLGAKILVGGNFWWENFWVGIFLFYFCLEWVEFLGGGCFLYYIIY